MTVTNVCKDPEALTMTLTTEFAAPAERVWQLWDDPRQLERWWGPPSYPATFVDYKLSPGGEVSYFMTGPEGDQHRGWWRVLKVDASQLLEFEDGFADDAGLPNPEMPVMIIRVSVNERAEAGTRMEIKTTFPSRDAMERIISMGMEEGMTAAISQIDAIL
jgi:uncharacterized protein YndB with AHSA1/START domain